MSEQGARPGPASANQELGHKILGYPVAQSLFTVNELGVPDLLADGPRDVARLGPVDPGREPGRGAGGGGEPFGVAQFAQRRVARRHGQHDGVRAVVPEMHVGGVVVPDPARDDAPVERAREGGGVRGAGRSVCRRRGRSGVRDRRARGCPGP
ncbi:hypothetical protein GCM10009801_36330 [Streptomyces albiaxialis]|uniref:Uncharacterized protein n=1 Tax=Streptomyces albiaxialis TaxID=329523 RepID=A0ABN2W042_9ACTN